MDKQSVTRRAALGLLAGGSTLLVSESLGFTQINTIRKVTVTTADDIDAFVGLEDLSANGRVSGPNDTATIYEITDNIGSLSESDIDVGISKLIDQGGTEITDPPVEVTGRNTGGTKFAVEISCTSASNALGGSYQVVLDFAATTDSITVTATRTTSSNVDISCAYDYGDSSNYRDDDGGGAIQPENPSGDIENPSSVSEDDGNTATAISSGGQEDLNVGFSLPPVNESADQYEIVFDIDNIKVGGGSFGFYLVNSAGDQLTDRQILSTGTNTYSLNDSKQEISNNYDDLYLIIDSETNGKGDREMELDYFQMVSN
jgi:hypothetical protein